MSEFRYHFVDDGVVGTNSYGVGLEIKAKTMILFPINLATVNFDPLTEDAENIRLIEKAIIAYRTKNQIDYMNWYDEYATEATLDINRHIILMSYLAKILDRQIKYSQAFDPRDYPTRYISSNYSSGIYLDNHNQQTIIYDFIFDRILFCTVVEYEAELNRLQELSEELWNFISKGGIDWSQWIESEGQNYLELRYSSIRLPGSSYYPFALLYQNSILSLIHGMNAIELDDRQNFQIGHIRSSNDKKSTRFQLLKAYDELIDKLLLPQLLDRVEIIDGDRHLKGTIVHLYPNAINWYEVEIFDDVGNAIDVVTTHICKISVIENY